MCLRSNLPADAGAKNLVYLLVDSGQLLYSNKANAGELFRTMKALKARIDIGVKTRKQPILRVARVTTYGTQSSGTNFESGLCGASGEQSPSCTSDVMDTEPDRHKNVRHRVSLLSTHMLLAPRQY